MLDKISAEISGFSKMFPVEASLANFTIFLNQGQKNIEAYYPQIDQMDFYRYVCACMHFYICINYIVGTKICPHTHITGTQLQSGQKSVHIRLA